LCADKLNFNELIIIYMKKKIFLLSVSLLGILATWYNCESEPEETCEQDEICAGVYVTYCCTENGCVYKYNGKEYTDDQLDELAEETGCGSASGMLIKSGSQEFDLSDVIEKLKALRDRVRKRCDACK
jgi:hypothetical protein